MVRVVVLDFDGVVVDSNRLKFETFFEILPPSARAAAETTVVQLREQSRYEILRRILVSIGESPRTEIVNRLAAEYDRRVRQRIIERAVTPSVRHTLEWLAGRFPLYMVSGTPQVSLRATVRALNVEKFFRGVYGAPKSKSQYLHRVLRIERTPAREVLVVGDGETDYLAAREVGCRFVAVAGEFNEWVDKPVRVLSDLSALPSYLESDNDES